ncbi:MAG: NAD(P)/FAD-dependent oxidoreductase [Candidatus Bathyarchaeota archaeon]
MKKYDVVVIGAGPGGSLAAKTASEAGLKTVIFERGAQPGDKSSSGCGLSPRIFRDFRFVKEMNIPGVKIKHQALHLLDKELNERFEVWWSTSDLVDFPEAKEFFQYDVYRRDFDRYLAKIAVEAGVELKTSTLVVDVLKKSTGEVIGVVTDRGEKVDAGVVIAADGALSLIAYKAGLRDKWKTDEITLVIDCDFAASKERMNTILSDEYCNHVYVSPLYPATYIAMMPEGFHIGFGQWVGRLASSKTKSYEYLKPILESKPVKRLIELLQAKPREFHAHLLPWMPRLPTKTYGNGIMLVGDAAGFPCPLEAEGIYYAMLSGKIAGEVAAEAVSKGDTSSSFLKMYEERWIKSEIGEEFSAAKEWAELWTAIFFNPPMWEKITPLASNIMFWGNWSAPHIISLRRQLKYYSENYEFILEIVKGYLLPLIRKSGVSPFKMFLNFGWKWLKTRKKKGSIGE